MDKEEFRIKLDEINHLVEKKDYRGAMKVVDSIDWRRVKNVRTLCVVGEIYAANKRYDDSKEIFLLAYHRAPIGKNILTRLIEISLKMNDIEDAREFYQEYKEVAPNDHNLYILKYKILSAKNAPLSEQIKALEEYKEKDFTEKWSYELAKLYYQAGDREKCLEICNEMILWFNEGSYVMRAMDLKLRLGALTGAEKERYDKHFVPKLMKPEDAASLKEDSGEDASSDMDDMEKGMEEREQPQIESISIRNEKELGSVESLQEKISKGIRDIFGSRKNIEDEEFFGEADEAVNHVQEEMLQKEASEKDYENIPDLEPENGKPVQNEGIFQAVKEASATEESGNLRGKMKMPELNIPESMKNFEKNESPDISGITMEIPLQKAADPVDMMDFNLEDTILAAASAQGIDIPEEAPEPTIRPERTQAKPAAKEVPVEKKGSGKRPPVELEEEEFLSEEDLRAAEEEFLNGPKKKPEKEPEIPRLEEEEIFRENYDDDEEVPEADMPEFLKEEPEEESAEDSMMNIPWEEEADEEEEDLSEEEELERFIESIQPKDERDPLDIIPRERVLTDTEKKLFTYFVKVPGMKEQLIDALCDAQMAAADKTSKTGNIIVMGGRETGKTRLIASLIPAICQERNIEASKVAYVFADQINGKDIARIVGKLAGGFLVIEDANQLTRETVKLLDKAMEFRTDGLTVILEDEKIGMRKLMARFPKFAKKFTSMINIPVFTNDELVNFARVYTKENGYRIDQMGMLALYNLIGINQKEDEPMNIGAVKELLDAAIAKSQGGLLKFNKKKRVDRDGYIVLYEKDFTK